MKAFKKESKFVITGQFCTQQKIITKTKLHLIYYSNIYFDILVRLNEMLEMRLYLNNNTSAYGELHLRGHLAGLHSWSSSAF